MSAPHYGKRNAGALTAASPGDTLFFNFGSYNDSGDSEALSGFAVTDIEVFKNGLATARATDSGYSLISDTGQIGDRVGLYRFSIQLFNTADDANFYASGSWYQVAVDSVSIDSKTVRFWAGSFEIGEPRANVVQVGGDTGAANYLRSTFAAGFADTGINDNLSRIRSDVDTGLRVHIDDLDTGLHAHISDVDTGIHSIIQAGVSLAQIRGDTGAADRFLKLTGSQLKTDGTFDTGTGQTTNTFNVTATATTDTGQVNNAVWNGARTAHTSAGTFGQYVNANLVAVLTDTGAAHLSGGRLGVTATASIDTGQVNQAVWQADAARSITASSDTGVNQRLAQIQSDVDTGLRTHINDLDTGLHDTLSDYDTGVRALLTLRDTGAIANAVWGFASRGITAISDTGLNDNLGRIRADVDTGLRVHIDDLDTGLHAHISNVDAGIHSILQTSGVLVAALSDTGVNQRLAQIQSDVDTGLRVHINDLDTGLHDLLSDYDTGVRGLLTAIKTKTDSLTFTVAGILDSNIEYVNATQITGTGDTGAGDTWRPV
jgi:hypothetical protein